MTTNIQEIVIILMYYLVGYKNKKIKIRQKLQLIISEQHNLMSIFRHVCYVISNFNIAKDEQCEHKTATFRQFATNHHKKGLSQSERCHGYKSAPFLGPYSLVTQRHSTYFRRLRFASYSDDRSKRVSATGRKGVIMHPVK